MECIRPPKKNKAMECNPEYSSENLEDFTEGFSEKNSLGYTQFGRLYRAKIEDKEVLVKRWYYHHHYGKGALAADSSIMREMQFLQKHTNFVNVIGYCSSGPEMGIIYDLNPMDSLENLIMKENFSWMDRIKVAYKVAELLETLHSELEEPYIVRNLDTAHIMIGEDLNPKLIDFAMLSGGIMGDRASQEKYVLVVPGYTAPDHIQGAEIDVYMYGVILLSLIAKRRAFDPKPPEFTELVVWAHKVYDPKQSLVHESLQKELAHVSEDGCAITALAMHCVEFKRTKRPTMKEIIQKLQNLRCFKSILAHTSSVQSRIGKGVHGPSISSMSVDLSSASAAVDGNTITLGGECMLPNVQDTIFEISPKYISLTRPIRRLGLGSGWCAAMNLKSSRGEEVAIRKIGNAFDNIIDAKRTLWEIKLLRHMDHGNVIAIKDIIRPPQKESFNDVYIVHDLMDMTLHQKIRSNSLLRAIHCRFYLCQLLRGLKHVHSANVLHCDLKPTNLLLKGTLGLKIGGFGLARTTSETNSMTENVATRWYWAPELLLKCSEYTAAIDIWSVGCILGEMMTTLPLFPGENSVHQLRLITELIGSPDNSSIGFLQSDDARMIVSQLPQYPKQQFSDRFVFRARSGVDLLEKMLVFDPNKRITVDEALCHPYLQRFGSVLTENVHVCPTPFNFNFEQPPLTKEDIKELIWEESVKFNPDPNDESNPQG